MIKGCDKMWTFIVEYWLQIGFGLIIVTFTSMIKHIKITTNKLESLQNGLKSLLRCNIIESYAKFIEKDYIKLSEKEILVDIYTEYKNLGGNGIVDDMMKEINYIEVQTDKGGNYECK